MAKVCGGIRLALLAAVVLLQGVDSQGFGTERPIECCQSSGCDSDSDIIQLRYSECCSQYPEFRINGTTYQCADLISFTESTYSVSEGANFIALPVQRKVNPGTDILLFRTFIYDGSATVGIDLGQFPDSGVGFISLFLGNMSTTEASVIIIDDNVVEHNENFTVGLQLVSRTFTPIGNITGNATVTIVDDDKVDITLDPTNATVTEPEGPLEFVVRKTGEAVRSVSVEVDLSDPELAFSTPGPDIRTLTFSSSEEEMTIMVNVPDDDIVEATEEHNIVLRVPEGETGVNLLSSSFPITVEDVDTLEITMAAQAVSVEERDGVVIVEVNKIGANERPVYATFITESGTAEAGSDFTSVNTTLEFLPNVADTTLHVEVNVSADGVVEEEEMFRCRLEVPDFETGVEILIGVTDVTIRDSDFITVSVDTTEVTLSEDDGPRLLYLRVVEGVLAREASVLRSLSPAGTQDITVTPSSLTFDPTNLNQTFILNVTDDDLYEGPESVTLTVRSSDQAILFSPSPLNVAISIEDNDSPQLTFSESVYSFNETAGQVEVIINFDAATETDHSWNLAFVPVTATEDEDYISSNQLLTFNDRIRMRTVSFEILDDSFSEGLETISLELQDGDGNVVNSSVVEIVDDEKLLISFTQSTYTASEGEQLAALVIAKSGLTTSDIIVSVTIQDITAEGGTDYGFFPSSTLTLRAVILSSETSLTYWVLLREDDIVENIESFSVSLDLTGNDDNIVPGNITQAEVFIEDNDKVNIFLSLIGDSEVSEEDSSEDGRLDLRFIVSRDPNVTLDRPVTVVLMTSPDTAGSNDFVSVSQPFTFTQEGPISFRTNVTVLDDDVVEDIEQFFISLVAPPGETGVTLPENGTTIVIISEDKIQVDFAQSAYTVNEADSFVAISVTKKGANEIPVRVAVETITADDTATAGEDYNATVQPLEFLSNVSVLPLIIPIVDDSVLEETERFTVELSVTANDTNVSLGASNVTEVTIVDNDSVTVEFTAADYTVGEEEGSVLVTVVKVETTEREVQVQVLTEAGTADSGDFVPVNRSINFPAGGRMEEMVQIIIIDNDACESAEEKFSVSLLSSDSSVVLGESSTVTIVENDSCGVGFENPSYTVMEPEPAVMENLTVCVERRGESNKDISMAIITEDIPDILVDQQALAGVDYILDPTPMFLALPFTERIVCFNISIVGDVREEELKMFGVRMIVQETEIEAFRAEANVTIMDEIAPTLPTNVVVEFESFTYNVRESAGQVEIGIRATQVGVVNETMEIVSVLFSTEDGKATSPEDFTAQTDTPVNFGPGDTRRTVVVDIATDTVEEGPEGFTVRLSLPSISFGVELGTMNVSTVTIDDTGDVEVVVNDTVLGDPLFVVPLFFTEDSHDFDERPSLCFEIHGQSGWYFNLVSDECTSVNAFYEATNTTFDWNVITEVGIKAVNSLGQCVEVRVALDTDCVPEIGRQGQGLSVQQRYSEAGVSVSRRGRRVRVSVPNCANFQLVMWLTCKVVEGQGQMRFDIARGFNLRPTSHGLLGQFWNIPIRVTPFVFRGNVRYDLHEQELYEVEVDPTDSSSRRFIAEYYRLSWDQSRTDTCLYAGDQQGGPIREIKSPNDPVIQGRYRFYRTDELFKTQFRYSQFNSSLCG